MQGELYSLGLLWLQLHHPLESIQFACSLHEQQVFECLVPSHEHHFLKYASMLLMQWWITSSHLFLFRPVLLDLYCYCYPEDQLGSRQLELRPCHGLCTHICTDICMNLLYYIFQHLYVHCIFCQVWIVWNYVSVVKGHSIFGNIFAIISSPVLRIAIRLHCDICEIFRELLCAFTILHTSWIGISYTTWPCIRNLDTVDRAQGMLVCQEFLHKQQSHSQLLPWFVGIVTYAQDMGLGGPHFCHSMTYINATMLPKTGFCA